MTMERDGHRTTPAGYGTGAGGGGVGGYPYGQQQQRRTLGGGAFETPNNTTSGVSGNNSNNHSAGAKVAPPPPPPAEDSPYSTTSSGGRRYNAGGSAGGNSSGGRYGSGPATGPAAGGGKSADVARDGGSGSGVHVGAARALSPASVQTASTLSPDSVRPTPVPLQPAAGGGSYATVGYNDGIDDGLHTPNILHGATHGATQGAQAGGMGGSGGGRQGQQPPSSAGPSRHTTPQPYQQPYHHQNQQQLRSVRSTDSTSQYSASQRSASQYSQQPRAVPNPHRPPTPTTSHDGETQDDELSTQLTHHLSTLQRSQTTTLESAFQLLLRNIQSHSKTLSDLSTNQSTLRTDQDCVREEVDLVYEKWSDLNGIVGNLERGLGELTAEVDGLAGLRDAVDALHGTVTKVQLDQGRADDAVGRVREGVDGLNGRLDGLELKLDEVAGAALAATDRLRDLDEVRTQWKEDAERERVERNGRIVELKSRLEELLDGMVKSTEVTLAELKQEVDRIESQRKDDKLMMEKLIEDNRSSMEVKMEAMLNERFAEMTQRLDRAERSREMDARTIHARVDQVQSNLPDFNEMPTLMDVHAVRDEIVELRETVHGFNLPKEIGAVRTLTEDVGNLREGEDLMKEELVGIHTDLAELRKVNEELGRVGRDVEGLRLIDRERTRQLTELAGLHDHLDGVRGELSELKQVREASDSARDDDFQRARDDLSRIGRDVEGLRLLDKNRTEQLTELRDTAAVRSDLDSVRATVEDLAARAKSAEEASTSELGRVSQDLEVLRLMDDERKRQLEELAGLTDEVAKVKATVDDLREKEESVIERAALRSRDVLGPAQEELRSDLGSVRDEIVELRRTKDEVGKVNQDVEVLRLMDDERKRQIEELTGMNDELAKVKREVGDMRLREASVAADRATSRDELSALQAELKEELTSVRNEIAELTGVGEELGKVRREVTDIRLREASAAGKATSKDEVNAIQAELKAELRSVQDEVEELRKTKDEVGRVRRDLEGLRVRERTRDLQVARSHAAAATEGVGVAAATPTSASADRSLPPPSAVAAAVVPPQPSPVDNTPVGPAVLSRSSTFPPMDPEAAPTSAIDPNAAAANNAQQSPPNDQITMALDGLRRLQESLLSGRAKSADWDGAGAAAGTPTAAAAIPAEHVHAGHGAGSSSIVEERLAARRAARSAESSPTKPTGRKLGESPEMQSVRFERQQHRQEYQQQHLAPASATGAHATPSEQSAGTTARSAVAPPAGEPGSTRAFRGSNPEKAVLLSQLRQARQEIGERFGSHHKSNGTPSDADGQPQQQQQQQQVNTAQPGSARSGVSTISPLRNAREAVAGLEDDLRGWEEDMAAAGGDDDHHHGGHVTPPEAIRDVVDDTRGVPYTPAEISKTREEAAAAMREAQTSSGDSVSISASPEDGEGAASASRYGAPGHTPFASYSSRGGGRDAVDDMARRRLRSEDGTPRQVPNVGPNNRHHPVDTPPPDPTAPNVSRSRTLAFRDMVSSASNVRQQQQQEQHLPPRGDGRAGEVTLDAAPTPAKPAGYTRSYDDDERYKSSGADTAPTPAKPRHIPRDIETFHGDDYDDDSYGVANHNGARAPDPPSDTEDAVSSDGAHGNKRRVMHDPPDDLRASVAVLAQQPAPVAAPALAPAPAPAPAQLVSAPSDQAAEPAPLPVSVAPASDPSPTSAPSASEVESVSPSRSSQSEDEARGSRDTPSLNEVIAVAENTTSRNVVVIKETESRSDSKYQFYNPTTTNFATQESTSFAAQEVAVEVVATSSPHDTNAVDFDEDVPAPPAHSPPPTPPKTVKQMHQEKEGETNNEEDEMAVLPLKSRAGFRPASSNDVASMRTKASSPEKEVQQSAQPAEQQQQQAQSRQSAEQQMEQRRRERILAKAAAEKDASPRKGASTLPPSPRDEQQRLIRRQLARKQRQQQQNMSPPSRHRTIVEEAIEFARASREAATNTAATAEPQQPHLQGAGSDGQVGNASGERRELEPIISTARQQQRQELYRDETPRTAYLSKMRKLHMGPSPSMTSPKNNDVSMVVTDDEEDKNGGQTDMENSILSDEMSDRVISINPSPATTTDDFEDRLANGPGAISPIGTVPEQSAQQSSHRAEQPIQRAETPKEGCYLVYFSDSGGKLILHYSRTPVANAIGFWSAGHGRTIQGFKFRQNSGRVELIKGIAGGDANKRKFFSGWCQFVKAAVAFSGSVKKFPDVGGLEVDLYAHSPDGTCQFLEVDEEDVDVSDFDAIACIPKHNNLFNGVKALDLNRFVNTANIAGAALPL